MVAGLGLAIAAYSCYGGVVHSVHFYAPPSFEGPAAGHFVDFGRAPQRVMISGWNNEMERAGTSVEWWEEESDDHRYGEGKYKIMRARNLEMRGDYAGALRAYGSLSSNQKLERFIRDRKEIFSKVRGREIDGLPEYLKLTYLTYVYDISNDAYGISRLNPHPILGPHVLYWGAEHQNNYREKARAYARAHYHQIPTERGQAGLIMAARTLANSEVLPATKEDWALAGHYVRELLRVYPRSRFRSSAIGILAIREAAAGRFDHASRLFAQSKKAALTMDDRWRAEITWTRVLARSGLRDKAIYAGLRSWASASSESRKSQIGHELKQGFLLLNEEETARVRRVLSRDPVLLSGYLGFRIEDTKLTVSDERDLAQFASKAILAMPRPTAAVSARVAQLAYNIGHYKDAERVARRGLRQDGDADAKGRARYVLAASLARRGAPGAAIREYKRLSRSGAPAYLRKGSLEPMAALLERQNRNVDALLAYIELDYELDIALAAEAFCTIPELRQAIARLRPSMAKDVLIFTLAKRLMRHDDYAGARTQFRRLGGTKVARWGLSKSEFLKVRPSIGWGGNNRVVPDPIATLDRLESLHQRIRRARGAEAKAQALYDKAAFIYRSQDLIFYSPGLWRGDRAFSVGMYWNSDMATKKQEKQLAAHFWEHESFAHSLAICREIIAKYPRSKVMPKALYTAAISADHLAGMNEWWRSQPYDLNTKAAKYLTRLHATFPNHPLAASAKKYAKVFDPAVVTWRP